MVEDTNFKFGKYAHRESPDMAVEKSPKNGVARIM